MTPKNPFDPETIRQLADILKETDLSEIEVEDKGLRVRVARQLNLAATASYAVLPSGSASGSAPAVLPPGPAVAAANTNAAKPQGEGVVNSPMVGTAYRASAPDKPHFVEVGSMVKQGQTLLTIEAMKTFNEIAAPKAGTVTEILVQNGQPVEFGQALVVIG